MLQNRLLRFIAVLFLALAFWLGIRESAWGMAVAAVIAGVLALLGFPDFLSAHAERLQSAVLNRLETVEFGKLKATLRQQIGEADVLIARLNKLTGVLAHPMYSMMARFGRWSTGMPPELARDMIGQLDAAMREAGYSTDQLNLLKEDVHYFRMFDLAHEAFGKLLPAADQLAHRIQEQRGAQASQTQLTPTQIDEKVSSLLNMKTTFSTVIAKPYAQMPDRLAALIEQVPWLTDDEKGQLRERINTETTFMREYLRSLTPVPSLAEPSGALRDAGIPTTESER